MDNKAKLEIVKKAYESKSIRVKTYYSMLEETGDMQYDYTNFVSDNFENDFEKINETGYHKCCCLLTYMLREDYFTNGAFEKRAEKGYVKKVLERMIELLSL